MNDTIKFILFTWAGLMVVGWIFAFVEIMVLLGAIRDEKLRQLEKLKDLEL